MIHPNQIFQNGTTAYSIGVLATTRRSSCIYVIFGAGSKVGDTFSMDYRIPFDGCVHIGVPFMLTTAPTVGQPYPMSNFEFDWENTPVPMVDPTLEGYVIRQEHFPVPKGKTMDHFNVTYALKDNGLDILIVSQTGEELHAFWPFLVDESAGVSLSGNCDPASFKGGADKGVPGDGNKSVGGDMGRSVPGGGVAPKSIGAGYTQSWDQKAKIHNYIIKGQPLSKTSEETLYVSQKGQAYIGLRIYQSDCTDQEYEVGTDMQTGEITEPNPPYQTKYVGLFSIVMPKGIDQDEPITLRWICEQGRVIIQASTERHGNLIPIKVPIL